LRHEGHTVEGELDDAGALVFEGRSWTLRQLHFHAPAEHVHAGVAADLELHLVHSSDDDPDQLLVLGVLYDAGAEAHAGLAPLFDAMPAEDRPTVQLDVPSFVPGGRGLSTYLGSRTMPPCTPGVSWIVLDEVGTVSADQLQAFVDAIPEPNARPVQPSAPGAIRHLAG
jgi:carbonic anhydrase